MKYPYLCFDADHTLFNFNDAEAESLEAAFDKLGLSFKPEHRDLYRTINNEVWRQFAQKQFPQNRIYTLRMERLIESLGMPVSPQALSDAFIDHLARQDRLNPAAYEVIRQLSENHQIAILTNGLTQLQLKRMHHSPIKDFISHHIIAEDIGLSKPDPRYFEHALQAIGCTDKRQALMIGDNLTADIGGAIAFGMDACWYNPHGEINSSVNVPTYEIHHMNELPAIAG